MPNDLSDHLGRSPIVRFGTAFPASQSQRARLAKDGAELKVTLLAVTELTRRPQRSTFLAFPFDEHQQLLRDLIVLANAQDPAGPDQRVIVRIKLRHFCFLRKGSRWLGPWAQACSSHASRNAAKSLIKYGDFVAQRYCHSPHVRNFCRPHKFRVPPYLIRPQESWPITWFGKDKRHS